MNELVGWGIALVFLVLGVFLGNFLARITSEELRAGQRWFYTLIVASLVLSVFALLLGNDALLFFMLFIAIVTSRSLKKPVKKKV